MEPVGRRVRKCFSAGAFNRAQGRYRESELDHSRFSGVRARRGNRGWRATRQRRRRRREAASGEPKRLALVRGDFKGSTEGPDERDIPAVLPGLHAQLSVAPHRELHVASAFSGDAGAGARRDGDAGAGFRFRELDARTAVRRGGIYSCRLRATANRRARRREEPRQGAHRERPGQGARPLAARAGVALDGPAFRRRGWSVFRAWRGDAADFVEIFPRCGASLRGESGEHDSCRG